MGIVAAPLRKLRRSDRLLTRGTEGEDGMIKTIKIHPAIGIARLGNSPEFFIGPELPGDHTPPPPDGSYKDAQCRMKKQAARFRLFAYDENGALVQEITAADASITWTAHLANTKAAGDLFHGAGTASPGLRNQGVSRADLTIDPGPRSLTGPNQAAGFNTGMFRGVEVPLGEMRTEADGRLLILGGWGNSGSPTNTPLGTNPSNVNTFANNDGWYDDVSDGPVTAKVTLNATDFDAVGAWVICAPPKYAPGIEDIITLYDMLFQRAVDKGLLTAPVTPSFNKDIFPILDRSIKIKWLFDFSHVPGGKDHHTLSGAFPLPKAVRQPIVAQHRDPTTPANQATKDSDMPRIWSDAFDFVNGVNGALTQTQYNNMLSWAADTFTNDWTGSPPPPETQITPEGLDRAALESCVGAAFFPGIETSWTTRDVYPFRDADPDPLRLDWTLRQPGDLTKLMSIPWQSDFLDCADGDLQGGTYLLLWWPAHRPDQVWPEDGSPQTQWNRDLANSATDFIQNWHRMGMVLESGDKFLETQRQVACKSCLIVLDRTTFSNDQVSAALPTADFDDSFYVVVDGFTPAQLGVTGSNMTAAQLVGVAPVIAPIAGVGTSAQTVMLQSANLNTLQRVTFVYRVSFTDLSAFVNDTQDVALTATIQGLIAVSAITLNKQPNPFMLDGPVTWLSVDLRVFQITESDKRFGITMGNTPADAVGFIQKLLTDFNVAPALNHPFGTISKDQQTSHLELSRSVKGKRVFNFAVAQVRYQGKVLDADNVRVFFRLFTTAATGLAYHQDSTYRIFDDGSKIVPLLGVEGGEVVTIPCFATARVDSTTVSTTTQPSDEPNRKKLLASATEAHSYFGCWLDFNQTDLYVPTKSFAGDGPYNANAKSIQNAIRGLHQCLVAEINFAGQPIPVGASPAGSDKLSQRNLAIVESDNPGGVESHTVLHTFEMKVSAGAPAPGPTPNSAPAGAGIEELQGTATVAPRIPPDELMIRWYNLPRDTAVTLYMPSIDVNTLLAYAAQRYDSKRLERVDAHTIRFLIGDVTFLPVPWDQKTNIASLLTLVLPQSVKFEEFYRATVHQISGSRRRIIGSFQISIPVRRPELMLEKETRSLAVLRSIAQSIPAEDRWGAVFNTYLAGIAGRVRGVGGDPTKVLPSPDGGEAASPPTVTIKTAETTTTQKQVQLTAVASDPNGLELKYQWRVVSGSAAKIHGTTPVVDFQLAQGAGAYVFEVTVTNTAGLSATATITINYIGR